MATCGLFARISYIPIYAGSGPKRHSVWTSTVTAGGWGVGVVVGGVDVTVGVRF
jgi:hypothetical protein